MSRSRLALLLPLVGALAALVLGSSFEPQPEEKVITVTARRFKYSPGVIEVNQGDRVRLRFISRDVYHGFYLDGYELETRVKRGEESELSFVAEWVAFSLGIIFPNGSYLGSVISDPFNWGWNILGTAGFKWRPFLTGLMPYLQTLTILVGLVFALGYGHRIAR